MCTVLEILSFNSFMVGMMICSNASLGYAVMAFMSWKGLY
jgi:hypothetical protein